MVSPKVKSKISLYTLVIDYHYSLDENIENPRQLSLPFSFFKVTPKGLLDCPKWRQCWRIIEGLVARSKFQHTPRRHTKVLGKPTHEPGIVRRSLELQISAQNLKNASSGLLTALAEFEGKKIVLFVFNRLNRSM